MNRKEKMDWRFNGIWWDQLQDDTIFRKDFKEPSKWVTNNDLSDSEYAVIWHLKGKVNSFENLSDSEKLLYLELNWANIKDFIGIEKFSNLKRLELHYCTKLASDTGLSVLKDSLEFLQLTEVRNLYQQTNFFHSKKLKFCA